MTECKQMSRPPPAGPVTIRRDGVGLYLAALAALCQEVSRKPRLLPLFIRIVALAPRTLAELERSRRRLAA
jgi:hypothetical protein